MNARPNAGSKKYYKFMDEFIKLAESKLPISVYGMTGYVVAFYWKFNDGSIYHEPNHAPIEVLEKLMSK